MKKIYALAVLFIVLSAGTALYAESINYDYSLNIHEEGGIFSLRGANIGTQFDGYITSCPDYNEFVAFYFSNINANELELTATLGNSTIMYRDGVPYDNKTVNVYMCEDLTPSFLYKEGKYLGQLTSEGMGTSDRTLKFANDYFGCFWLVIADPATIGWEGAATQLFCTDAKISSVPVPPAFYLFATGLAGLIGFRKKQTVAQ